jgi:Icc-related predicted phosphoesterase
MVTEICFPEALLNDNPLRIAWTTDLHLDAADKIQHRQFFDHMIQHAPDALLIGGDISNGATSLLHLKHFAKLIQRPCYFVLGNHDYYYGSITKIRGQAHEVAKNFSNIHYLTDGGVFALTPTTALVGHDGWSDGRAGDFFNSDILLNDYYLIEELKNLRPRERLHKLNQLGSEAGDYIKKILRQAFLTYERAIILTHTPPIEKACFYDNQPCDANWAPHFVCKALGDAVQEIMKEFPNKELLILCGHSHSGSDIQLMPNLRILTGQSELGQPQVQGIILVT